MSINKYRLNAFDKPLVHKGINIYPMTLKDDYALAKHALLVLTRKQLSEDNLDYLGLYYIDYIKQKCVDTNDNTDLHYLEFVLSKSFRNCDIKFVDGGFQICYYKEDSDDARNKLIEYYNSVKDVYFQTQEEVEKVVQTYNELERAVYHIVDIKSHEFDEFKKIICDINAIDDTIYTDSWELQLIDAQQRIGEINKKKNGGSSLTVDDQIRGLAFYLGVLPHGLEDMSLVCFDQYIAMLYGKEEYETNIQAMLQGVDLKGKLKHWITHQHTKSKYDNVIDGNFSELDL